MANSPAPDVTPRPVAKGEDARAANRRRVSAELYESADARRSLAAAFADRLSELEADVWEERYAAARATLHGMLLVVESLDLMREKLGRPERTFHPAGA